MGYVFIPRNCNSNTIHTYISHFCPEMIRAGAIAKQVINELKTLGVDIKTGATGETATKAKAAFVGRTVDSYYTAGKHVVALKRA